MKSIVIGIAALAVVASALADTRPSRQLVEQYLEQAHSEKAATAQVDGYVAQLAASASPEEKARMRDYLNATIGWKAIKDQYASLVETIYTAEELKAAMAFVRSPLGSSITRKNQRFAQEMAALIAANVQRVSTLPPNSGPSDGGTQAKSASELVAVGVEEHNLDGRTYFTGAVENRGKQPSRGVEVVVNLFLAGRFVDQYSTYMSGTVVPGASRYFKVSCGCKDTPPAKHDSFKVEVVGGGY